MIRFKKSHFYQITMEAFPTNTSDLPANARATISVILNKVTYLHYNLLNRLPRIRRWQAGL